MKTAEELKQNINVIKRQIGDLSFEKAKLELELEDIEPSEYIDHCCVCGCSSKEKKINIHSSGIINNFYIKFTRKYFSNKTTYN